VTAQSFRVFRVGCELQWFQLDGAERRKWQRGAEDATTPTQKIHFEHTENDLLAPPVPLSVRVVIGGVIVMSVVLAYSAYAYRVFRGKTPENGWEE
jgi:hypothetical protein